MTKAWLIYFLMRVGIFALALTVFVLLGIDPILSALFAAVLGLAVSLLFLGNQRDRVSTAIYERRIAKPKVEAEDEILERDADQN